MKNCQKRAIRFADVEDPPNLLFGGRIVQRFDGPISGGASDGVFEWFSLMLTYNFINVNMRQV